MGKITESLFKVQNKDLVEIGKFGRTIGFKGILRLYLQTDFPHTIAQGNIYKTSHTLYPFIKVDFFEYSADKNYAKIHFESLNTEQEAKKLTNYTLYATITQSREQCSLKEGEFFWFDIIGCAVIEGTEVLGEVRDIERIGNIDYMLITTDSALQKAGFSKSFLLPYIEHFVLNTDIIQKRIITQNARDILENS